MLERAIRAATVSVHEYYRLSAELEHPGEKGGLREIFVNQLIRPFVPHQFGIGSGVVIDAKKRQSRQSDLIIYDRRLLPPIFLTEGRGIFPIDSVLAVVEVKSRLKASYLKSCIAAARRISPASTKNPKGMVIETPGRLEGDRGQPQTYYPHYAIFAYESSAKKADEGRRLEKRDPNGGEYVSLIGVLNKGVWQYDRENLEWKAFIDEDMGNNSEWFLLLLLNKLVDTANSRGDYRLEPWLKHEA